MLSIFAGVPPLSRRACWKGAFSPAAPDSSLTRLPAAKRQALHPQHRAFHVCTAVSHHSRDSKYLSRLHLRQHASVQLQLPNSRSRAGQSQFRCAVAGTVAARAVSDSRAQLPVRDGDEMESEEWDALTQDEVDDRVEAAAAFIGVLDELRPLDPKRFNAAFEVWKVIKRIPPAARPKLLSELDPGAIRGLWRHSMSRYVLDDERALQMFGNFSVLDDLPEEPGQVYTYLGRCEQFVLNDATIGVDEAKQSRYPRSQPWLKPSPGSVEIPQHEFTAYFFAHPTTGEVYCRTVLRWIGNLDRWWVPIYARLNIELVLTPMQSDAGADMTLTYPLEDLQATAEYTDGSGTSYSNGMWSLQGKDLPHRGWPAPRLEVWSPFSRSGVDYMRVVGPGVYVGCAYRTEVPGVYRAEDNLYFLLVRRP